MKTSVPMQCSRCGETQTFDVNVDVNVSAQSDDWEPVTDSLAAMFLRGGGIDPETGQQLPHVRR